MTADPFTDALAIAVSFTGLLERLGIPYLVGGSVASSVHGEPRSTNDIDIVADIRPENPDAFVEAVSPDYYVSPTAALQAVRSGASFNVIHVGAAVKVDLFVAGSDPFNEERLRQRRLIEISDDPPASIYRHRGTLSASKAGVLQRWQRSVGSSVARRGGDSEAPRGEPEQTTPDEVG
jgi:hypothetical protein